MSIMFSFNERTRTLQSSLPIGFKEIMIDSGGFQLQTGSSDKFHITLGGYCMWLQMILPRHPEVVAYMNLDMPNDPEKSLANLLYMESQGLHPLPIWGIKTGEHYLDYYCSNYEYVAIGGMVRGGIDIVKKTIEWVSDKYPKNRFHFLGMGVTSFQVFRSAKPYSVDCSTWTDPVRFGHTTVNLGSLDEDGVHLGRKGGLRVRLLPLEVRNNIRTDRKFAREMLLENIHVIKQMEDMIEEIPQESWQRRLL